MIGLKIAVGDVEEEDFVVITYYLLYILTDGDRNLDFVNDKVTKHELLFLIATCNCPCYKMLIASVNKVGNNFLKCISINLVHK